MSKAFLGEAGGRAPEDPAGPRDTHETARLVLEATVLRGPGATEPALRQAASRRAELPPELQSLVEKIHRHAHRVTDEDLLALKDRYTEDQLFELVVAASLGAALDRLHAGLAAIDAA